MGHLLKEKDGLPAGFAPGNDPGGVCKPKFRKFRVTAYPGETYTEMGSFSRFLFAALMFGSEFANPQRFILDILIHKGETGRGLTLSL